MHFCIFGAKKCFHNLFYFVMYSFYEAPLMLCQLMNTNLMFNLSITRQQENTITFVVFFLTFIQYFGIFFEVFLTLSCYNDFPKTFFNVGFLKCNSFNCHFTSFRLAGLVNAQHAIYFCNFRF